MGCAKALLSWGDQTLLERQVLLYGQVGAVYVAVNRDLTEAVEALELPAELAVNTRPERGLFSSVHLVVNRLPSTVERLLVTPVDCPLPDLEVPHRLLEEARGRPEGTVFVPTFDGHRGHPVLLTQRAAAAAAQRMPTSISSQVLEPLAPVEVPVDEPWIRLNLNTPEDYTRFLAAWQTRRNQT